MNVTVLPSWSASMRSEVTTMGSRPPLSGEKGSRAAPMSSSATSISWLFLKNRLDIPVHHHFPHVHLGGKSFSFEIDLLAQDLERVRGPDQPLVGLPEQGVRRHQITIARDDAHLPDAAAYRGIPACR